MTDNTVHVGWVPWDTKKNTYAEVSHGTSWWEKKKTTKFYRDKAVCERYKREDAISLPVFLKVTEEGNYIQDV